MLFLCGRIMRAIKYSTTSCEVRESSREGGPACQHPHNQGHEPALGYHCFMVSESVHCAHAEKTLGAFNSAEEQCLTRLTGGTHSSR
jgi:hypothetical protein